MSTPSIILLRNGLLATFTAEDAPTHTPQARRVDVLVEQDRITRVAEPNSIDTKSLVGDMLEVDCTSKWIAPGFVDTHRHLWMSVVEGYEDRTLLEYLAVMTFTTAALVTSDDVYIGQLAGSLQALNGGVTSVVDHFHCANSPDHIHKAIQASSEAGLRNMLCVSRQSLPTSIEPLTFGNDAEVSQMQVSLLKELAQKDKGRLTPDGRVTLGLAYDVLGYNPDEDKRILALARELGITPITAHYPGGPQARAYHYTARKWHDAGLLRDDVVFSHANGLLHADRDEKEWEYLKASGASIAVTPEDELGMGHGDPPMYEAVRRGVKTGLGIDCACILSTEMFPAMRIALQWERGRAHHVAAHGASPKATKYNEFNCASVFRLATLGGAEAAHRSDIGSIEPGKLADIVLYDADSVNLASCPDPFKGIAIHATGEDVSWVIVNGRVLKKERKLLPVQSVGGELKEWKDIAKELQERIASITEQLNSFDLKARYDTVLASFGAALAD